MKNNRDIRFQSLILNSNGISFLGISMITPSPLGDGPTPGPLGKEKYTCTHSIVTQVVGGQTVYSLKCTNDYSEPSGGGGLLAAPTY